MATKRTNWGPAEIEHIKFLREAGCNVREIARKMCVSTETCYQVACREDGRLVFEAFGFDAGKIARPILWQQPEPLDLEDEALAAALFGGPIENPEPTIN